MGNPSLVLALVALVACAPQPRPQPPARPAPSVEAPVEAPVATQPAASTKIPRERETLEQPDVPELPDAVDSGSDLEEWDLGRLRTRGSIHSDVWRGSAADLADKYAIAVYPVNGWWRFHNKEPEICQRSARYALLVSIETEEEDVDIYSPVLNRIAITT